MITSKQREEAAIDYTNGRMNPLDYEIARDFTEGAIWAEKTILEMASEGFDEWLKNQNYSAMYLDDNIEMIQGDVKEAYQAATLAAEKRHAEKIKELEAMLAEEEKYKVMWQSIGGKANLQGLISRNDIMKKALEKILWLNKNGRSYIHQTDEEICREALAKIGEAK